MAKMNFETSNSRARQEAIKEAVRRYQKPTYFKLAEILGLTTRTVQMYVYHMRKTQQLRIAGWTYRKGSGNRKRWQPQFGPWVSTKDDEPRPPPITPAQASRNYRNAAAKSSRHRKILKKAASNSARRTKERNLLAVAKNAWDPSTRVRIAKGKEDPRPYRRNVTPDLVIRMRELRAQGWTYQEIGLELGVSRDTVSYHYNKDRK